MLLINFCLPRNNVLKWQKGVMNMVKEIQFQRSKQRIFAMDENYNVIGDWECRDDFVPGYNEAGDPRGSLPDGVYTNVSAEVTNGAYGAAYGTFYITTHDPRARDIHGGGSGLPNPFAGRQGWVPTYGCLRMQNIDGEELSRMIIAAGNNVVLTVVP